MRRHHTRRRLALLAVGITLAAGGCTPTTSTDTETHRRSSPIASTVTFAGIEFDVGCSPVAEALTDIELPHHGQPKMRAIAGLWDHQALAVLANRPKGCGVWTLAVAHGISDTTRTEIEAEAAAGVEHFGVTASPVPKSSGG